MKKQHAKELATKEQQIQELITRRQEEMSINQAKMRDLESQLDKYKTTTNPQPSNQDTLRLSSIKMTNKANHFMKADSFDEPHFGYDTSNIFD